MNSNSKLISIDLDGTTLSSNGEAISDFTCQIIKKVESLGHTVVIATGRPYRLAIDFYKQLGLNSPMINFNGGLLSMPNDKKWKHSHKRFIPKKFVFDLLKHQQNFDLNFIAAEYRRKFYLNNFQGVNPQIFGVEKFEAYHRLRLNKLTSDPHCILLATDDKDRIQQAKEIQSYYKNEISVSAWGGPDGVLEIVPKGVNKAYALEKLTKALGYTREQVIAFGDEFNDVEMFQYAQTSYAVKNASERLIGHADEILNWTNEEDGVAKKLSELFL